LGGLLMGEQSRLQIVPMELRDANAFVAEHHRHHRAVVGHRFSIGVVNIAGDLVGVAIIGRPITQHNDDGFTVEVLRVATDGTPNACSALYGAAWRAAKAMGYRRALTYTLKEEPGTSLRAAGWTVIGEVRGKSWNTPTRPRVDKHPTTDKLRWAAQ
jgi:hypothetical protein